MRALPIQQPAAYLLRRLQLCRRCLMCLLQLLLERPAGGLLLQEQILDLLLQLCRCLLSLSALLACQRQLLLQRMHRCCSRRLVHSGSDGHS